LVSVIPAYTEVQQQTADVSMKRLFLLTKLLLVVALLIGGYVGLFISESQQNAAAKSGEQVLPSRTLAQTNHADSLVQRAFTNRLSDLQVELRGRVAKVLADDRVGSRHQRFILRLDSGQTLLVAHNIDLAPRLEALAVDDRVELYGEYEWNARGGVIHWTHRDPQGSHADGWIRHRGRLYQ
jgi:hypothetical protein